MSMYGDITELPSGHWMENYAGYIPDDKKDRVLCTFPVWGPEDEDSDSTEPTNHIALFVELDPDEVAKLEDPQWGAHKMTEVIQILARYYLSKTGFGGL